MEKRDELDSTGELKGYISLDQVILQAQRRAREDQERYRQRLGWEEIVWSELSSEESEKTFRVVLQFRRPGRGVREEQTGEEEFVFDQTGKLEFRQVLAWPEGAESAPAPPAASPAEDTNLPTLAASAPEEATGLERGIPVNVPAGAGGIDYGAMLARDIISLRESAEPAVFHHKALLITVNKSATETSLYEATRWAWKVSKSKAKQAEVILDTRLGLIVGAFIADDWLDATASNFPGHDDAPGRVSFVGYEAPADVKNLYIGKRIPDEYRRRGAANPIKYTWGR